MTRFLAEDSPGTSVWGKSTGTDSPGTHCISRCVRRAFLCGQGFEHRKQWIEDRLKELVGVFVVSTQTGDPAQDAGLWLMPIDDHRPHGECRVGLIAGCTLSCYLRLIDATSRVLRDGKASLAPELAPISRRLNVDQEA
jgi:hypothetical protein